MARTPSKSTKGKEAGSRVSPYHRLSAGELEKRAEERERKAEEREKRAEERLKAVEKKIDLLGRRMDRIEEWGDHTENQMDELEIILSAFAKCARGLRTVNSEPAPQLRRSPRNLPTTSNV
ncbi:hypothetical protein PTTG_09499 [Puccinia triticina 1-1 BBBD Race 1]|uniref:Uncharacterized protein n=2 Tax=Puccinia triticina TaxID=208348 RepID=A0A0C4F8K1_PUCT1|nr:hypothetical protein PTTG_09499 [Puccinia triticina 1-1 BBBD Race 1]